MKWNELGSDTLYLMSKDYERFVIIQEGNGDNLLTEDVANGYMDYWLMEEYDLKTMSEIDSAQWLENQLISDIDYTIEGVIQRNGFNPEDFIVLQDNDGTELQEILDEIAIQILSVRMCINKIKRKVSND